MSVTTYKAKFHALFRYGTQLLDIKEERILLFIKDFIIYLQLLIVYMSSSRKTFNDITDYVKNLEAVKQVSHAKVLANKSQNMGKFNVSYSRGYNKQDYPSFPIQLALPTSIVSPTGTTQQL